MNYEEFLDLLRTADKEPSDDDLPDDPVRELMETGSVTIPFKGRKFVLSINIEEVTQ